MAAFALDRFDLGDARHTPAVADRPPRHRPGQLFIRGPIPMSWFLRAASLPGRAATLGIWLWYLAGRTRCATVRPQLQQLATELGCNRTTLLRALRKLEEAKLVTVVRAAGSRARVRLLALADERDAPVDRADHVDSDFP